MTFSNDAKRIIKKIAIIEVALFLVLFAFSFYKWKNKVVYSPPIGEWNSECLIYNEGFEAGENLLGAFVPERGESVTIISSPYMNLPSGMHSVLVDYESDYSQRITVDGSHGDIVMDEQDEILRGDRRLHSFRIDCSKDFDDAQIFVEYNGNGRIKINNIIVTDSIHKLILLMLIYILVVVAADAFIYFILLNIHYITFDGKVLLRTKYISSWLFCVFSLMFATYVVYHLGRDCIDSDMAAEMILTRLLNFDKRPFMTENWFYSSEIRVVYIQQFFRLALLFFSDNWHLARTFGMFLAFLLLYLIYFLFARLVLNDNNKGRYYAALLLLPFGISYLFIVIWGGYYIPHICFMMGSLAIVFRFLSIEDKESVKIYWLLGVASLISMVGGLGGIRYMMNMYFPLFVASFLLLAQRVKADESLNCTKTKEFGLMISSVALLLSNVVGILINAGPLHNKYKFTDMTEQGWGYLHIDKVIKNLGWLLESFGYQSSEYYDEIHPHSYSAPQFFSLQGIAGAVGLLIALFAVFSFIRLYGRYERLSFLQKVVLVLTSSMIAINMVVYSFSSGHGATPHYWVPVLPYAMMVIVMEMYTERFTFLFSRFVLLCAFAMATVLVSVATTDEYYREPTYGGKEKYIDISNYLLNNGYDKAIARYWSSNVMTELTNGKVEMWSVEHFTDVSKGKTHRWLQKTTHDKLPEETVPVIFTSEDYDMMYVYGFVKPDKSNILYLDNAQNGILLYDGTIYTDEEDEEE